MPEGKYIKQKKHRFNDVTFAMTCYDVTCAKKLRLLWEEKNPKL